MIKSHEFTQEKVETSDHSLPLVIEVLSQSGIYILVILDLVIFPLLAFKEWAGWLVMQVFSLWVVCLNSGNLEFPWYAWCAAVVYAGSD